MNACRASYVKAVKLLIELASLQTAFVTLDQAIKVTNRRVNALENVVKPKIENTIQYIKVRVCQPVMAILNVGTMRMFVSQPCS